MGEGGVSGLDLCAAGVVAAIDPWDEQQSIELQLLA